jgi:hypothetical protein
MQDFRFQAAALEHGKRRSQVVFRRQDVAPDRGLIQGLAERRLIGKRQVVVLLLLGVEPLPAIDQPKEFLAAAERDDARVGLGEAVRHPLHPVDLAGGGPEGRLTIGQIELAEQLEDLGHVVYEDGVGIDETASCGMATA